MTATSYDQLKSYAESTTAYIIRVQGTISNGANGGKVSVKSNKTIVGVGSTAFLNGVGLEINNNNNIIIQNLRISLIGVTTRTETAGVFTTSDDEGLPADPGQRRRRHLHRGHQQEHLDRSLRAVLGRSRTCRPTTISTTG